MFQIIQDSQAIIAKFASLITTWHLSVLETPCYRLAHLHNTLLTLTHAAPNLSHAIAHGLAPG